MSRIKTDKQQPSLQADQRLKAAVNRLEAEAAPRKLIDHAHDLTGLNKSRQDRRS